MKKVKSNTILKRHCFVVNEHDNGGESLSIITEFIANGDPIGKIDGVFVNQEISLQSYCNSATFNLVGATLSPTMLRKLADELEDVRNEITFAYKK